jgi:hemoglobin
MKTLYESMGGEPAVRAVIQTLYDALFVDPIVGFLFEGKDKAHLVTQQVAFTCQFLGGPQRYEGQPLPQVHAALPLLPGHFDRRHHLLRQALEHNGVPEDVRRVWLQIDQNLRSSVLKAGEPARDRTRGG